LRDFKEFFYEIMDTFVRERAKNNFEDGLCL